MIVELHCPPFANKTTVYSKSDIFQMLDYLALTKEFIIEHSSNYSQRIIDLCLEEVDKDTKILKETLKSIES